MEHGDKAACVVVDSDGKLVLDDVWNGFDDLQEYFDSPKPILTLQDDELLPLSKERSIELWKQDLTVYLLYEDNTEEMAFDRADIENHSGLFGIETSDCIPLQDVDGDSKSTPPIWQNEENPPRTIPQSPIQSPVTEREATPKSTGDGPNSHQATGADNGRLA